MQTDLPVTDKVTAHAQPVDARGNSTNLPLDAPPSWTAANPLILATAPAADGLSCVLSAIDIGVTDVTVAASYKGNPLTPAVFTVNITAGIPSGFVITFDAPIPQ
jgi:hypothetical protein